MHTMSKVWIMSSLIPVSFVYGQAPLQPPVVAQTNSMEEAESSNDSPAPSSSMQQMRARLTDPVQRAALRAEERKTLKTSHAGIAEALGIDAVKESALIELLTDQRLEQLDDFYGGGAQRGFSALPPQAKMAELAQQKVRHREALVELLGEKDLDRYLDLEKSLSERARVNELNARLDAAHKLQEQQREQLIMLWFEHHRSEFESTRNLSPGNHWGAVSPTASPEELERRSQLQTIAMNEDSWRRKAAAAQSLNEDAAAFLSKPQLAELARMQAEETDGLKRWIQQARVQAGLNPNIPQEPERPAPSQRTPLETDVRVSIRLSVDAQPTVFTHNMRNGQSVTFTAAQGLLVEVTPVMYADNTFELRMKYFEQGGSGKRLIGDMGEMGTWSRDAPPLPLERRGGAQTMVTGRKAYAIEVSSYVEPI